MLLGYEWHASGQCGGEHADILNLMRRKTIYWLLAVWMTAAHAADGPVFEVASVKAVTLAQGDRRGCAGGPGTASPGTWICGHVALSDLIVSAWRLERYEFQPAEWMMDTWVAITAKIPEGATPLQFRKMQQNLLEERFRFAFHREPKEMTVYELVIAKGGARLRESAPDAPPAEVEWGRVPGAKLGPDHFPEFPEGRNGLMGVNGRMRWRSSHVTMADLVNVLRREMGTDVVDRSGLNGQYDVDLFWQQPSLTSAPDGPSSDGPEIQRAIQNRLGLKLESKKGRVGVVVIDRIEKVPTEN